MKIGIDKVLSMETRLYKNDFVSAKDVRNYLEELGYKQNDLDSNGWDYDFWWNYKINEEEFCISGNGYNHELIFSRK